ncbi:MAG: hypothetical protein ACM3L6_06390, partial [Deltaproteobacteria bacterium]
MNELKSRHYLRSRRKNRFQRLARKALQMGFWVAVGEVMLLRVIGASLSSIYESRPIIDYTAVPQQIFNLAVSEKPILRIARSYDTITRKSTKEASFDNIIQKRFPAQVKGARPDFRTLDLQDKEGAQIGLKIKF